MNFLKLAIVATLLAAAPQTHARICENPNEDQGLCLKMKTFRAQLDLMDEQRELFRADYAFMSTVGGDMVQLMDSILSQSSSSHLKALQTVRSEANEIQQTAINKEPETFVKANRLSENCLACHSNNNPTSGVMWDEISTNNWSQTSQTCSLPGKNPYFCRAMHGMLTIYSYFVDADKAQVRNFEAIEKTGEEMVRLTGELASANMVHGGLATLGEIKSDAELIVALAKAKDPSVFKKSAGFFQSCAKCHPN